MIRNDAGDDDKDGDGIAGDDEKDGDGMLWKVIRIWASPVKPDPLIQSSPEQPPQNTTLQTCDAKNSAYTALYSRENWEHLVFQCNALQRGGNYKKSTAERNGEHSVLQCPAP